MRPPGGLSPESTERVDPYGWAELAIRAGAENSETPIVATVVTGTAGAFSLTLAPGSYCVLNERSKTRPPPTGKTVERTGANDFWTDMDCMRARWRQCEAVLVVPGPAELTIMDVQYGSGCNAECRHGPTPP